jgi:putative transcriptional regulator
LPPEADSKGTISNLIRRLRFERGEMTQQELAQRVGVTRQTIIALEAGKYIPSLLLAFRLAQSFGVSIEGVFQYHNSESNAQSQPVRDGKSQ